MHNPLSRGGGSTCAGRPLHTSWVVKISPCATLVWYAVADDGPKPETETGVLLLEGSMHNPLSRGGGSTCAGRPLHTPGWLRYLPLPLGNVTCARGLSQDRAPAKVLLLCCHCSSGVSPYCACCHRSSRDSATSWELQETT